MFLQINFVWPISNDYPNEVLGSYVACILTMYYCMSLCNVTFLTCLKPLHRFTLNVVWIIFLEGPLPRVLNSGFHFYCTWNYRLFCAIFGQFFEHFL